MKLGTPAETAPGETRVACTAQTVRAYLDAALEVLVESAAGVASLISDEGYREAGATIIDDGATVFAESDILVKVRPPNASEIERLKEGAVLIGMLDGGEDRAMLDALCRRGVSAFALDAAPRITRAQPMDVRSSQATIAGYEAAILAAGELAKLIPMLVTAAGTIRPASALVIGAGVAGLQAIATCKRLGASVTGVDVRPAAAEQIGSLGAKFVSLDTGAEAETAAGYAAEMDEAFYRAEQEILAPHLARADIVIASAMIPRRPAPKLITAAMVEAMAPGAVIVDMAAPSGGNCSLTEPDRRVEHRGVVILGPTNLPASAPAHASMLYARNVAAFVADLVADGAVRFDLDNPICAETLLVHEGQIMRECAPERSRRAEEEPS